MVQNDGFESSWSEFWARWGKAPYNMTETDAKATWSEIVARRVRGDPNTPVYQNAAAGLAAFEATQAVAPPPTSAEPAAPSGAMAAAAVEYLEISRIYDADIERTGGLTPQAQWRLLGYGTNDDDEVPPGQTKEDWYNTPPPPGTPIKQVSASNPTAQSKYELMRELAESQLDEEEIPEADPFRPWFMSRLTKYWLETTQTFAFQMAEDDYEEAQDMTAPEKAAVDQTTIQGQINELKAQLIASNEALQKQMIANQSLAALQALPAGEVREKGLEDFIKNVLPQLLAVGGAGAGILASGGLGILGGALGIGGGQQGALGALGGLLGGQGQQQQNNMMNLMMMQMMQQMTSQRQSYGGSRYSSRSGGGYSGGYRKKSYRRRY